MKRIIYFLLLLFSTSLSAQQTDRQILVFRNTGIVDLIYETDLDSIVTRTGLDGSGDTQCFFARDTTLIVPLAEIDSVAFGSRNAIEFLPDVHQADEATLSYIVSYRNPYIYYRKNTPAGILPKVGEKLFFGERNDIFPNGLCARITAVRPETDAIAVTVTSAEPAEIFSRFFYAGPVNLSEPLRRTSMQGKATVPIEGELKFDKEIDIMEDCKLKFLVNARIEGQAVLQPLRHFYHVNGLLQMQSGFGVEFECRENGKLEYSSPELARVPMPPVAYILHPSLSLSAFADLKAEMSLGLDISRFWNYRLNWTRHNGQNSFQATSLSADGADGEDKIHSDLTLKGEVFFGPLLKVDFRLLGVESGARFKIKAGPELYGELGMEVLRSLDRPDTELYGKGKLSVTAKGQVEGCLFAGDNELKVFETSVKGGGTVLNLFPEFTQTRGIRDITQRSDISLSTRTDTPIARERETGFELVDATGKAVDSIFVKTPLQAKTDVMQGVAANMQLPVLTETDMTDWKVRPVFHYAGYTVRAAESKLSSNCHIEPIISLQGNGTGTYISGLPFSGTACHDLTFYTAGPYLPSPVRDTLFAKPATVPTGIFINSTKEELLLGEWHGTVKGKDLTLLFSEDSTGSLTDGTAHPFTYTLNTPRGGNIRFSFGPSATNVRVLTVVVLTAAELRLKTTNGESYTFYK